MAMVIQHQSQQLQQTTPSSPSLIQLSITKSKYAVHYRLCPCLGHRVSILPQRPQSIATKVVSSALAAPQQHWGQQGNQLNGHRGGSWQQNNQWGNNNRQPMWNGNSNNGGAGFPNPNDGGQQKGYRSLCKCQVNGEDYPDMGKDACDELSSKWPNLQVCIDLASRPNN